MARFLCGWFTLAALFVGLVWPLAHAYPVSPVAPKGVEKVYERAEELIDWIVRNSDYEPFDPPPIVYLSGAEMRYIVAYPHEATGHEQTLALYFKHLMVLPDTFQLGRDDFMLLHELVHHAQTVHGRKFACMSEREKEAYDLQIKFVNETGVGLVPGPFFYRTLDCKFEQMGLDY